MPKTQEQWEAREVSRALRLFFFFFCCERICHQVKLSSTITFFKPQEQKSNLSTNFIKLVCIQAKIELEMNPSTPSP